MNDATVYALETEDGECVASVVVVGYPQAVNALERVLYSAGYTPRHLARDEARDVAAYIESECNR